MVDLLRQAHAPTQQLTLPNLPFYQRTSFRTTFFVLCFALLLYNYLLTLVELDRTKNELDATIRALSQIAVFDGRSKQVEDALASLLPVGTMRRKAFLRLAKEAVAQKADDAKLLKVKDRLISYFGRVWKF